MKQVDKHQAIILVLAAVVMVAFGVFRYMPIVNKKIAMKEQMAQQSLPMEQIQEYSQRLPELKLQKKALEENQREYLTKIPEGKQFAQLWQHIAEAMNECRLEDQMVQPGIEEKSADVCCIPLKIECRGTLEQMFTFLQKLEKLDRLVCFEEIQLENSSDFSAVIKLNAKAKVYYQPEKADNS